MDKKYKIDKEHSRPGGHSSSKRGGGLHLPIHRSPTLELLAQISKSAHLIHEKYRKIELQLDHAIDIVVSHMDSQSLIESDLTPKDWETIEQAKVRIAAKKAKENEKIGASRNIPGGLVKRHSSVPNVAQPVTPPPRPWYEDDRFPKPYRMRQLCITNGFTDVADEFAKHVNTFAHPSALVFTNANPQQINPDTLLPRYTHKVELGGYTDAQIVLKFDEEHVLVYAERPKSIGINHRETIEVIYLPEEIFADHLKIARDEEGTLWMEERPHYALSYSLNF